MALKCLFVMVLGLVACLVVGSFAEELPGEVNGGGGNGDPTDSMACVKKLIPCQPYLRAPEKVPVSCCLPLKQMVSDDMKCLCGLFNNLDVLKKINLTQAEALKLPKACGAKPDISICKKDSTSPPKSPETPSPHQRLRTIVLLLRRMQPIHPLISAVLELLSSSRPFSFQQQQQFSILD